MRFRVSIFGSPKGDHLLLLGRFWGQLSLWKREPPRASGFAGADERPEAFRGLGGVAVDAAIRRAGAHDA